MKAFPSILADTYSSWCMSLSHCLSCHHEDKTQPQEFEKKFVIIDKQPSRVDPLVSRSDPVPAQPKAWKKRTRPARRRKGSTNSSFSMRRRLLSNASSTTVRRPQISAPTNFQHVYSGSYQFPEVPVVPRKPKRRSFRPLELSIYFKDNHLSPMLPHFDSEYPSPPRTPPNKMISHSSPGDDAHSLARARSYSSVSFHVPRRAVPGGSIFDSPRSVHDLPSSPPKVPRKRAYTSTDTPPGIMEDLVERVAQAMLERDQLQERINDAVERQSLYSISRPGTAHEQRDMEPMPEVPALPPNAPSFSERLNTERSPTTPNQPAPPTPLTAYPNNSSRNLEGRLPPPPLPLRLRPPLRKKKSFSRVSNWLSGQGGHSNQLSLDSVTNFPKAVTGDEGFYEVAQPAASASRRSSFESVSSASAWSATEEQTVPTSWSPGSDKTIKAFPDVPNGMGLAPGRGFQAPRYGRNFVFPGVPQQQVKPQASVKSFASRVGVAV